MMKQTKKRKKNSFFKELKLILKELFGNDKESTRNDPRGG